VYGRPWRPNIVASECKTPLHVHTLRVENRVMAETVAAQPLADDVTAEELAAPGAAEGAAQQVDRGSVRELGEQMVADVP